MSKVLIIGAGAAGMMAGIAAAYNGNQVEIFEKNDRVGKKIFITGKGRCNITNASDIENHFSNILKNEKFLYSAYNKFNSEDICNKLKEHINGVLIEYAELLERRPEEVEKITGEYFGRVMDVVGEGC